jgi:hypothetical protein
MGTDFGNRHTEQPISYIPSYCGRRSKNETDNTSCARRRAPRHEVSRACKRSPSFFRARTTDSNARPTMAGNGARATSRGKRSAGNDAVAQTATTVPSSSYRGGVVPPPTSSPMTTPNGKRRREMNDDVGNEADGPSPASGGGPHPQRSESVEPNARREGEGEDGDEDEEEEEDDDVAEDTTIATNFGKAPPLDQAAIESLSDVERRRVLARWNSRLRSVKRRIEDCANQFPTSSIVLVFTKPFRSKERLHKWYVGGERVNCVIAHI